MMDTQQDGNLDWACGEAVYKESRDRSNVSAGRVYYYLYKKKQSQAYFGKIQQCRALVLVVCVC